MTDGTAASDRSAATPSWEEERVSLLAGWSNVRFSPELARRREHRTSRATTSIRAPTCVFSRIVTAITHSINWDIKNQSLTQHRIASYYNAQCCGFSAEYQFIDLTRFARRGVQQDSRFHFSVTLGGIGNVSNIFGALGGTEPEVNSHAR